MTTPPDNPNDPNGLNDPSAAPRPEPAAPVAPVAPGYGQYGVEGYPSGQGQRPRNGLGIAALVIGILSILTAILFPLAFLLGLIGIGLGLAGRGRAKRGTATNGGMALTGLILSGLGLLLAVAIGLLFSFVIDKVKDCDDPSLSNAEVQQCVEDRLTS